jgi:hypothetical protein
MAESHIVSGLVAKRGEMAGLIDHHQKQIVQLAADLGHLDATLKLFAPDMDLRTLRPKEHRERNAWFRPGEAPRFILDTLRQSVTPLTSRDLTEHLIALKGMDGGADLIEAIQKTLGTTLRTLLKRGTIAEGPRMGVARTWRIA